MRSMHSCMKGLPGSRMPLAGLDEEIDDLRQRDVEQRRHLGARMHHPVQVDPRRGESDAQVARAVHGVLALDQFAAQEERRGNRSSTGACGFRSVLTAFMTGLAHRHRRCRRSRSCRRPRGPRSGRCCSRTDGPLRPQAQGLKSSEILSPVMTPPQRPSSERSKNAARPSISPLLVRQQGRRPPRRGSTARATAGRDSGRPRWHLGMPEFSSCME